MATRYFCDRCGDEIKGSHGKHGSVVVKFDNMTERILDMLCKPCTDQIVHTVATVNRAAPKHELSKAR